MLGIVGYAVTLVLALRGGAHRHRDSPWLRLAVKTAHDVVSGADLTAQQASRHRRFCAYCLVAAAAGAVMFPNALPEARAAAASLAARPRRIA